MTRILRKLVACCEDAPVLSIIISIALSYPILDKLRSRQCNFYNLCPEKSSFLNTALVVFI